MFDEAVEFDELVEFVDVGRDGKYIWAVLLACEGVTNVAGEG